MALVLRNTRPGRTERGLPDDRDPKLAVLFTTLLPQFVTHGDPAAKPALLAGVFIAIGMTWLCVYVVVVQAVAHSRTFRRATEAVSGVVLIALGARLAIQR